MSNLKDAMQDAGIKSKKTENMRKSSRGRVETKNEKNQQTRNFCEVCELTQPDVERFKHRNPTVDAEWICSGCADKNDIPDETRQTNQSDFAKQKRYRREFGALKVFTDEAAPRKDAPARKNSNNRNSSNRNNSNRNNNNRNGSNKNGPSRNNSTGPRKSFGRDDNRQGRGQNRPAQGRRPNNRNGNGNNKPAPFTIDEDGEKNFNC